MVKTKDSTGNITASFGADFFQQGATSIPNLLLKYYKKIGLSDLELILIIHLLRFKCEENDPFPTAERLRQFMASDEVIIKGTIAGLIEKGIITVTHYYDDKAEEILNAYSYDYLFERISEVWARDKMRELQRTRSIIVKNHDNFINSHIGNDMEKDFAQVHKSFEREFGRLLSPIEIEQIQLWLVQDGQNTEIVIEALRRAVLMGKHNFKYIDSILLEWKKNNLQSLNEINSYETNFKQRQGSKNQKTPPEKSPNNKKEKIKMLYNL